MKKSELTQPLLQTHPEPPWVPLSLQDFIILLKAEEDYWQREENNTLIQITRLRKIFYDKWGWDTQVIRQAANIEGRYEVMMVEGDENEPKADTNKTSSKSGSKLIKYKANLVTSLKHREFRKVQGKLISEKEGYHPLYCKVVYRKTDRLQPTRMGETPDIYKDNHQEVRLPAEPGATTGNICDIGHILSGLDAYNYPDTVGVMRGRQNILRIGPHVISNVDMATWLGDIASASAVFLLEYFKKGSALDDQEMQAIIDKFAPGSDMLGNIDAYVIAAHYDINSRKGMRFSDILDDYYISTPHNPPLRHLRFRLFCEAIGLKGWDGNNFCNEKEWLKLYEKQLLAATCFLFVGLTDDEWKNKFMAMRMFYCGLYKDILKADELLNNMLKALKEELNKECNQKINSITEIMS